MAIEHTRAAGWDLLDAYNITRPLLGMKRRPMWDGRHFLGECELTLLGVYLRWGKPLDLGCLEKGRQWPGRSSSSAHAV